MLPDGTSLISSRMSLSHPFLPLGADGSSRPKPDIRPTRRLQACRTPLSSEVSTSWSPLGRAPNVHFGLAHGRALRWFDRCLFISKAALVRSRDAVVWVEPGSIAAPFGLGNCGFASVGGHGADAATSCLAAWPAGAVASIGGACCVTTAVLVCAEGTTCVVAVFAVCA